MCTSGGRRYWGTSLNHTGRESQAVKRFDSADGAHRAVGADRDPALCHAPLAAASFEAQMRLSGFLWGGNATWTCGICVGAGAQNIQGAERLCHG
jgi:hypothetical protein